MVYEGREWRLLELTARRVPLGTMNDILTECAPL